MMREVSSSKLICKNCRPSNNWLILTGLYANYIIQMMNIYDRDTTECKCENPILEEWDKIDEINERRNNQ